MAISAFQSFAVAQAVRTVNETSELVLVGTTGGMRITPTVSKLLNVRNGDYLMFIDNRTALEQAVLSKDEEALKLAAETGMDIDSPEFFAHLKSQFLVTFIAKGILEKDGKGNPKKGTQRMTKEERIAFVEENYDALVEKVLASENQTLIAILNDEETEQEVKVEALSNLVKGDEIDKYMGSKLSSSTSTAIGVSLSFSNSHKWNELKEDIPMEERNNVSRTFVVSDNFELIPVFDGYETLEVKAFPLKEFTDEASQKSKA